MRYGLLLVLALGLPAGSLRAGAELPPDLQTLAIQQRLGEQVPRDALFRDETGRKVRLGDYFDQRPVILVLAYYRCPKLCTLVLNRLTAGLKELDDFRIGREFTVITVSFDPEEGPELARAKKKAYVEQYGDPSAAAGWHFLTGQERDIKRLADAVGFRYAWDAERKQYKHPTAIMLLTADGKVARYFLKLDNEPRDLRFGLIEASQNRIGTPVDQALLIFCYTYDPVTGTYRFTVLNLVRLAGVVTVLVIVSFWVLAWRRSRRAVGINPPVAAAEPRVDL